MAGRARLRLDAGLPPGDGGAGPRGDRAAPAPEPGRHVVGGDQPPQAGLALHGHDARDHLDPAVHREGPAALRLPRQGPRGPAAGARGRRPPGGPVHHRHPRRHRRDRHRAGGVDLRDPARGAAAPATCRRSSSRTSGPSRTPRCGRPTTWRSTSTSPRSPSPGSSSAPRCGCRPRRTSSTSTSAGCSSPPASTTSAASRPLTPDHVNPERPWPSLDRLRSLVADSRFHPARAAHGPPRVRPRRRALDRPPRPRARRRPRRRRTGWPGPAYAPRGCPGRSPTVASSTVRAPAGPTCTPPSTPTAAPPTAAATSTTSTATGTLLREQAAATAGTDAPHRRQAHDSRRGRGWAWPPRSEAERVVGRAGWRDGTGRSRTKQAETDPEPHRRARPHAHDRRRRRPRRGPRAIADGYRRTSSATTSPTSSTGTSTSPTSATPAAGSARSPSAVPTPTRTR